LSFACLLLVFKTTNPSLEGFVYFVGHF